MNVLAIRSVFAALVLTISFALLAQAWQGQEPETEKIVYRLMFDHKGKDGPYTPEVYLVEGNSEKKVNQLVVAPGDKVKMTLLQPDTKWELDKWEAKFLWVEDKGKDPDIEHKRNCSKVFRAVVGKGGLSVAVSLKDQQGNVIDKAKNLTQSETRAEFTIPEKIAVVHGLMDMFDKSRKPRDPEEQEMREGASCGEDGGVGDKKYKLQSKNFVQLSAWDKPLVVEVEIERVP